MVKFVIHKVTNDLNILKTIKHTNKMQLSMQGYQPPHIKNSRIPCGLVPTLDFTRHSRLGAVSPDFVHTAGIQVLPCSLGAAGC